MTANAKTSFGSALWMAPDGSALVKIAELLTVSPGGLTRDTIDVTTHDSAGGAMEYISSGVFDAGEVSGQVHYIAGSTQDDAFLTALGGGLQDFKIVVKAATGTEDISFSGFVTSYQLDELPVDGKQAASFTIKVTGARTQAASA
jgi:hypothetical protein